MYLSTQNYESVEIYFILYFLPSCIYVLNYFCGSDNFLNIVYNVHWSMSKYTDIQKEWRKLCKENV